jgi:hypothetical protein
MTMVPLGAAQACGGKARQSQTIPRHAQAVSPQARLNPEIFILAMAHTSHLRQTGDFPPSTNGRRENS